MQWGVALYNTYSTLIQFSQCDVKVVAFAVTMRLCAFACFFFVVVCQTIAQVPSRLSIPGAVLVSQPRARPRVQQQIEAQPIRIRKPFPNAIPSPQREIVRPVVEELEENEEQEVNSNFEDEVAKLGISTLQTAVRQAAAEEEPEPPKAVQFRPERPLPILRQDLRESPRPAPRPIPVQPAIRPAGPPPPITAARPAVSRPALFQENLVRPTPKQEYQEENVPVRRPTRPAPQEFRQTIRATAPSRAPPPEYLEEDEERRPTRGRKPLTQILRKFRTDNEDGSITWGFETDDGTFKEETIGVDCITRGKFGYVDPDGVRREYNYETGAQCEEPEEDLQEPQYVQGPSPKAPNKKIYRLPA